MTAGLRFVVYLQGGGGGGVGISAKNSTSRFPTTHIFFEKGSCKVHDEPFQPRVTSQPGLSTRVEISTRVVM